MELPEREKLVATLYCYAELTLREIGEALGISESRVSQLHAKPIRCLKAHLPGAAPRDPAETKRRASARRPSRAVGYGEVR